MVGFEYCFCLMELETLVGECMEVVINRLCLFCELFESGFVEDFNYLLYDFWFRLEDFVYSGKVIIFVV